MKIWVLGEYRECELLTQTKILNLQYILENIGWSKPSHAAVQPNWCNRWPQVSLTSAAYLQYHWRCWHRWQITAGIDYKNGKVATRYQRNQCQSRKRMITDANDTGIKVVAFINDTGGHFSVCGRWLMKQSLDTVALISVSVVSIGNMRPNTPVCG